MTDRDDYPAAAAKAGRVPPAGLDPALMVRLLSTYEQVKRERAGHRLRGRPALHRRPDRRAPAGGRRGARPVPPARRRRVPGRQPAAAGAARPVARRPRGGLRRRRPEPDHLHLRRRVARLPARLPPAAPVGRARCGWCATTAPPRRWSQLANRHASPAARPAGAVPSSWWRSGRPARSPTCVRCPTSRPRPGTSRPRSQALLAAGTPASEVAVLFRTNGQSETYEQALADARVPYVLRGGERFFDRPEVREARLLLRGAARSRRLRRPGRRRCARCSRGSGWSAHRPRVAARSASAGSRWRRWPGWPTTWPRPSTARDAARLRRRARRAGRRAARADRRGRHARLAARRQGPGVGRRVRRRGHRRHGADHLRRDTGAGRGGASAALRRRHPGPRAPRRSPGRWPGPRAAARSRRPSRFLDGLHASSAQPPVDSPGPAAARARPSAGCAARRSPAPVARKLGRCEDCPSAYDEALFERLREWRAEQARAASVPAYVVFTDATLTALAEVRPTTERELLAISGVGRTKLDTLRRRRAGPLHGRTGRLIAGPKMTDSEKSPTGVKKMIAPDGGLP